ncbi:V-type ATP synthase subunit E [Chlamydia avium]|nr:V-type ATP synthase subunit E [Chlamydia avium]
MADLSAENKLKQICDALRIETLKPAEDEAATIVENAKENAKRIVLEAQEEANRIIETAREEAELKLKQGEASLAQAGKRALEALKQAIENKIFKESLAEWLENVLIDSDVSAKLISALIQAIEEKGISGELIAYVGKHVAARSVNEILGKEILAKLKSEGVAIGKFVGGVQLRVEDRNLVLDLSSDALLELLSRYLQKDFREMVFQDS